jgi:hypothetical protein
MKNFKKIIVTISLIGVAGFIFSAGIASAVVPPPPPGSDLVVELEGGGAPLFSEANFVPGQSVTRWVNVTNNSSETKTSGVQATYNSDCSENCLSDQLELEISDGGSPLYGPVSLTQFFEDGQQKLSDLSSGSSQKYYFKITFLPNAGNQYQGKQVEFDFDIGLFAQETGETGGGSGGGGGGTLGGSIELIISEEGSSPIVNGATEITWKTNKLATSRVIYSADTEPHTLDLTNPPNYGYARSTEEDSTPKMEHSMDISGLGPGVTYFYRVVSRGSFAISLEHSFTVPGVKASETFSDSQQDYSESTAKPEQEGSEVGADENELLEQETEEDLSEQDSEEKEDLSKMLMASFGNLANINFCVVFLIFLIIVIALMLMSLENNKKQKDIVRRWILTFLAIIALIILYSFMCPYYMTLLIAVAILVVAFLLWYFKKDKKPQN